ncbi:MAG: AMP-binding protein [Gemmataceae bacterium]
MAGISFAVVAVGGVLAVWFSLGVAAAAVVVVLLAFMRWPGLLYRPLLWLITHTIYRMRVLGREHLPAEGPALIVCNHVSYIDWLILLAAQRRFIRFVIWAPYTQMWGIRHLLRWAGAIPIDGASGPRSILKSLRAASDALQAGELVCIFAEGGLTRTGFMLPFHRGFEQILKHAPAPIIPACLDQVWGSIFSYWRGKVFWKWPLHIPYPVTISFGAPMEPTATAADVRLVIQKLSADCAVARTPERRPVHRQFVRMACRHPFRLCMVDVLKKYRYAEALAGAMIVAHKLKAKLGDDEMVGVWLPPSGGAALTNIALAFLRKTSVNLNYTSSPEGIASALRQCDIRWVLTSRAFTQRVPISCPEQQLIYLEDFRGEVTKTERLWAFLKVVLLPGWVLERLLGLHRHQIDDLATVIFSSGSTGDPKGVMLTHNNIAANAESMIQAIDLSNHDRLLGILPFFHSFGYTVTLWAPLQTGASSIYHPDPRQAKKIGELIREYQCTIFLTTPTFLRFCLRQCGPEDFLSLRLLVTGAEKLSVSLADEFERKFQIRPLEGYGCTELSPAAAANVPDRPWRESKQIGNKPGTIGQPLPGIAAKIVDVNTYQTLPPGEEGLLLMYGANVMKGYLGKPELTQQVIRDGWYVTGDMGIIDADGFITLTGRLSRFAKIGGEMVPLEKIEEEINHIVGHNGDLTCTVTAVPDDRRGERVIILHKDLNGLHPRQVVQELSRKGLPNLWMPDERDFHEVQELPVLGSGKLDLKRIQEMAMSITRRAAS